MENLSIEGTAITSQGLLSLCRLTSLLNVNIKGCMLVQYNAVKTFLMGTLVHHICAAAGSLQIDIKPMPLTDRLPFKYVALDNIKDFLHDEWQLSPLEAHTGLKWEMEVGDDDLLDDDYSDDEFDPEAAHDRLVDMMNRFGAH